MNINRHNYEEFFLLYVDNELSATERNAVDLFVQQNPDLGQELQLLQQVVVRDDDIVFEDKKSLLKEEGNLALQEKLLLFADDELPLEEKSVMFTLLATDSAAAAEWKILQQTKLQPDESVVFEDKQSLYRTEGARIIGFKWWRVAAAAVLLGFGIWLGRNVFTNDKKTSGKEVEAIANNNTDQLRQNKNTVNPAKVEPAVKEDSAIETVKPTSAKKDQEQTLSEKDNLVKNNQTNNLTKDKQIKPNDVKLKENNIVKEDLPIKKPSNNLPKSNLENVNNLPRNKNDMAIVQPKTSDNNNNIERPVDNRPDVAIASKSKPIEPVKKPTEINESASTNNIAKNAVYSEADENKGDTRILYMDEEKIKRTKIGGLFRRLKRVVERTTNIKTGNSVKIAGFEIAIK